MEYQTSNISYTFKRFARNPIFVVVASIGLFGCGSSVTNISSAAREGFKEVAELQVVDCLLPGQVNRLGDMMYVSERRATRTTAYHCNLRGGEYAAYDRADYRSALRVWLTSAKRGDAEAQTYVGEIFEKGLGQSIDYNTAAGWYRKAAEQGHSRAQINLGYLYEKGLGVEKDLGKALAYYRSASGSEELVFASDAKAEIEKTRIQLQGQIDSAEEESRYFSGQLSAIKTQFQTKQSDDKKNVSVISKLYTKSQNEITQLKLKIAGLPLTSYRSVPPSELLEPVKLAKSSPLEFNNIEFGRYFALIIGNQDYLYLDDLSSPHKDALRLKEVLEAQYGFSAMTLLDASEKEILNAFDNLYNQIGPKDNLLVFYAGHGNLSRSKNSIRKRGYWLPTDAEPGRLTNWISNSVISDHLDRIKARSILVIADSCFAGNLASERSPFLLGSVNANLTKKSIEIGISRRSRSVISSGGEKPVLDGINGDHSIFANALISLLENNDDILRDNSLFSQVSISVRQQARLNEIDQTPEMRPIRAAGHEGGDFYFIPTR